MPLDGPRRYFYATLAQALVFRACERFTQD